MSLIKLSKGSVAISENWSTESLPAVCKITDQIGETVRAAVGEVLRYVFEEHTLWAGLDDEEIGKIELSIDEDAGIGALEWKLDLSTLVDDFIEKSSLDRQIEMRDLLRAQADKIHKNLKLEELSQDQVKAIMK